jgi:hypothetical protein
MSVHKSTSIDFTYEELLNYQAHLNKALAISPLAPFSLADLLKKINDALDKIEAEL